MYEENKRQFQRIASITNKSLKSLYQSQNLHEDSFNNKVYHKNINIMLFPAILIQTLKIIELSYQDNAFILLYCTFIHIQCRRY